jgi:uncharacterized membrane protein YqiK
MSAKTTTSVNPVTLGTIISWSFLFIILLGFWGCPKYRVWQQEMEGKAEFAKAEQNRRIKIEEAKANLEAEKLNAEAEVERAKGAAKAIQIENGSITEKYIQYLWVRQQSNLNDKTVIYIPTEGNLPILEASRKPLPKVATSE